MPRKTEYAQQSLTSLGGRIEHVLKVVWSGNQRRMAADLGCSQALISLVVRGEQAPGPKLLEALSKDPRINVDWLLHGVGELLSRPSPTTVAAEWLVPVARSILPGLPGEYAGAFSGIHVSLPACYRSPTRYLTQIQLDDLVVRAHTAKVAAGDYMLLEADRKLWRTNPRVLHGKHCGVRIMCGDIETYLLASVDWDQRSIEPTFDLFGAAEPPTEHGRESRPHYGMDYSIRPRGLEFETPDEHEDERGHETEPASKSEAKVVPHDAIPCPTEEVSAPAAGGHLPAGQGGDPRTDRGTPCLDDVVAVAVLLFRLY